MSGAIDRGLGTEELPPEIAEGLSPEQRRMARQSLTALAVLGSGSLIGVGSSLYLANHYPLLLIALSPIGRHLILIAPTVNPFAFIAVGVGRRLLFYSFCFRLGDALGPAGLVWIESRAVRTGRFVRWLEGLFRRAARACVFFLPGPGMSMIAGISGMPGRTFFPLAAAGLVFRMVLILLFAEWMREPIEALLRLIDEYWIPGTVVLVLGVGIYRWRHTARQGSSA